MGYAWWAIAVPLVALMPLTATQAAMRTVAVFNFELIDTSLEGSIDGPRADEARRLDMITQALRAWLAGLGTVRLADTAPVAREAAAVHLQECGGCDADLARRLGADLSVTGTVQKVSNLILNMNIYVRDAASGKMLAGMSADMRGNTDESWMHTLHWLERNRLPTAIAEVTQ
jgi:hypothetical protein